MTEQISRQKFGEVTTKMCGSIKHKLRFKGETTALLLLRHCVLQTLPTTHSSDVIRTYLLQRKYRYQYYRVIAEDLEQRYTHTYGLNCCPVGFEVKPITRFCNNPKVCPWCFVRRWLFPIYSALSNIPKDIRQSCKIIVWQRTMDCNVQKLPFFRSNKGPHQWCSALATVQLCVPFVDKKGGSLQLRHVGIQLVPAKCDYVTQLSRRVVSPRLTFVSFEGGTTSNIVRAMITALRFPWVILFARANLESFQSLLFGFQKSRLLRITKHKPQGAMHGN